MTFLITPWLTTLWVGNLPPGVAIVDVKDFFSRSATHDIESVRLISKSNCAFVNYRTEAACQAAAQRFDDARMLGFRLSCRMRNAASGSNQQQKLRKDTEAPSTTACDSPIIDVTAVTEAVSKQSLAHLPARYFILKSLTEQDIAASIRSGQWSTQIHNEGPLNDAHKVSLPFRLRCICSNINHSLQRTFSSSSPSISLANMLGMPACRHKSQNKSQYRTACRRSLDPVLPGITAAPALVLNGRRQAASL